MIVNNLREVVALFLIFLPRDRSFLGLNVHIIRRWMGHPVSQFLKIPRIFQEKGEKDQRGKSFAILSHTKCQGIKTSIFGVKL